MKFWRVYKNGEFIPMDDSLDYGANFAHMLGFDSPAMLELMRLYVTIHTWVLLFMLRKLFKYVKLPQFSFFRQLMFLLNFDYCCSDHEGGNVSAHTGHLVSDSLFPNLWSDMILVALYDMFFKLCLRYIYAFQIYSSHVIHILCDFLLVLLYTCPWQLTSYLLRLAVHFQILTFHLLLH